jgi:hypothetical protein
MLLANVKKDVYHIKDGDFEVFKSEQELIKIIKDNDIADVIKSPIGYVVGTNAGTLLPNQYLRLMSESAKQLLLITLKNKQ